MLIGAQISSAGGLYKVFERAAEIGAEAIQVFLSAPQQWKPPTFNDEQVAAFRSAHAASSLPVFVHGSYLMNFGSKDEALLNRSVASLRSGLRWAGELGMVGTVFHVGSHLGAGFEAVLPNVCARIREAMEASPNESRVLLETNAGQGNCIGRTFAELGAIIRGHSAGQQAVAQQREHRRHQPAHGQQPGSIRQVAGIRPQLFAGNRAGHGPADKQCNRRADQRGQDARSNKVEQVEKSHARKVFDSAQRPHVSQKAEGKHA